MACYLWTIFSTLVNVIQENVHELILRITVSHWNWYSLFILESLDVINLWFPYFMWNFQENLFISTFSGKVMFAQCDWSFEIHTTPSPGNSAIKLLLRTSIFSCRRFLTFLNIIFYILPSYFWIIYKYFTSFLVLWKYHFQWFYKGKKINLKI